MVIPETPTLTPPEALAQSQLLDILIDQTEHLGRNSGSPARRIASGQVETRLRKWKDELQPLIESAG